MGSGWRGRRGLEGTHCRKLTGRGAEGNGMGGGIRARAVSFRSSHRAVFHVCLPFWERSGGEGCGAAGGIGREGGRWKPRSRKSTNRKGGQASCVGLTSATPGCSSTVIT